MSQKRAQSLEEMANMPVNRKKMRRSKDKKEARVELQQSKCTNYQKLTWCVTCLKGHSELCRFRLLRAFRSRKGEIDQIGFPASDKNPTIDYPTSWNIHLNKTHLVETKNRLAGALLPVMRDELAHFEKNAIRRPFELEFRTNCDLCMTSIFSASWLCSKCGREICVDCLNRITSANKDQVKRALLYSDPGFDNCSKGVFHEDQDFVALTRFRRAEIEQAIAKMESLPPLVSVAEVHSPEEAPGVALSHAILRLPNSQLTDETFCSVWARGEPILITKAKENFKLEWTPAYFIQRHGTEECTLVNCETDVTETTKVADFFRTFGKYKGRNKCLKLKDWPPASDFATTFPALYEDFERAVPVANHVRRDGIANMAAYFPTNGVAPDLGPKMYNAHGNAKLTATASTRLHMDMADALNILMHAEPLPDKNPGGAMWDIYRAQDSEAIRLFLREEFPGSPALDPIHGQEIYITDQMRMKLWETRGIKSYHIFQREGEAIMIPAGCAHQVRNISDCIKVAIDFVSLDNIERCEKLTSEFRAVNNGGKAWKADVLQLRSLLWFAWETCCREEDKGHQQ